MSIAEMNATTAGSLSPTASVARRTRRRVRPSLVATSLRIVARSFTGHLQVDVAPSSGAPDHRREGKVPRVLAYGDVRGSERWRACPPGPQRRVRRALRVFVAGSQTHGLSTTRMAAATGLHDVDLVRGELPAATSATSRYSR